MKTLDFVVCEDIRSEFGGKFSLMGVFPDTMLINFRAEEKWPFITRLSFYIKLDPEGAPPYPECKFQVFREGTLKSAIPLQVATSMPTGTFVMMLNIQPFSISSPGILNFGLEFSGDGLEPFTLQLPPFEVRLGSVVAPNVKDQPA